MEEWLKKKFKTGIVLDKNGQNNTENMLYYLNKYKDAIGRIYFSPIKEKCATRDYIYKNVNENYNYYYDGLLKLNDFCLNNEIKLSFALNTQSLVLPSNEFKMYQKDLNFDEIICLSRSIPIYREMAQDNNVHFSISFNEPVYTENDIINIFKNDHEHLITDICYNQNYFRNIPLIKRIKNEFNVKSVILLNNGCLPDCQIFCQNREKCKQNILDFARKYSLPEVYAKCSLIPDDIRRYYYPIIDNISYFKLARKQSISNYTTIHQYIKNDNSKMLLNFINRVVPLLINNPVSFEDVRKYKESTFIF
jgi:hypothetical protein